MNVRLTVLLVLVLALIGGTVAVTASLRTKERVPEPPWLFKVDPEDIAKISVTHQDKNVEYAIKEDGWVIKDGQDTPVFLDKWSGTTLLLSGPRSSRAIQDATITDPALYGLDSPQTTVQLIDKSGFPIAFLLGDTTPDGENWYAQLVGSDRLFTVVSVWAEVITKLASEPPYPPTPTPEPEEPDTAEGTPTATP